MDDATYFESPEQFRRWLERHHARATELWVGFHKRATGRPSLTWPQSVDEALCFGWIDGIRKRVDEERYVIRFTPRKTGSTWSLVNVRRVAVLTDEGRMHAAGLAAFAARIEAKSGIYSYEQPTPATLSPEEEARFRKRATAWRFFESQPPWYRRTAIRWVTSAKRAETRARRMATLIEDSGEGRRIGPLRWRGE